MEIYDLNDKKNHFSTRILDNVMLCYTPQSKKLKDTVSQKICHVANVFPAFSLDVRGRSMSNVRRHAMNFAHSKHGFKIKML